MLYECFADGRKSDETIKTQHELDMCKAGLAHPRRLSMFETSAEVLRIPVFQILHCMATCRMWC